MELTDEDINEFIAIWKEEFSEEITADYARRRASELLKLFLLLATPPASENEVQ